MELYLRWLEKYEQQRGEDSPIGLILCADKSEEQIKLLQLDRSGIRVAAYLTELPPRNLLQKKLHEAILLARARLEGRNGEQGVPKVNLEEKRSPKRKVQGFDNVPLHIEKH